MERIWYNIPVYGNKQERAFDNKSKKQIRHFPCIFFERNVSMVKTIVNKRHKLLIAVFILVFAAIGFGFLVNTAVLQRKIIHDAEVYSQEDNEHDAIHFEKRMEDKLYFLGEFADIAAKMPEDALTQELLEHKSSIFSLDQIVVLSRTSASIPPSFDDPEMNDWMQRNPQIFQEPTISASQEHGVMFTVPILKDGIPSGQALLGTKEYTSLQCTNQQESEQKDQISLLVDSRGELVFATLGGESMPQKMYNKIQEDLTKHFSQGAQTVLKPLYGKYTVDMLYGKKVVVSVHPLSINGWTQISITPWNINARYEFHLWMYFLLCILFALVSAAMVGYVILQNIRAKKVLNKAAYHDFLTDGMTNKGFQLQARELLDWGGWSSYTMLYFDVCSFEYINETWGFEMGNKCLRHIYDCMNEDLRQGELTARSENDHFFLMIRSNSEREVKERVTALIDKINIFGEAYSESYLFQFSVGAYIVGEVQENVQILQDRARRAAKFHDKNEICTFYDYKIIEKINRENRLNALFEDSLKNHDFQVYLQPKVYLQEKKPCAAEALVRWVHPEEGMIYPSDFIPLFEDNGKICALDLYVFEEVCKLIAQWREENRLFSEISVNVSREHLKNANADFEESYHKIKDKYHIPDGLIQLELTETSLLHAQQLPHVAQVIRDFHEDGFTCALDDFGFGYSSLSMLKDFSIDTIKLDRGFFVNESQKSRIVVENMIRLAHDMDIEIVAEGIEEKEQVELLRKLGCDLIQGYYYSKPLSISDFVAWQNAQLP